MSANTYLPISPVVQQMLLITAITNAYPAVVTVSSFNNSTYVVGQLVHFEVPATYGMFQIDQQTAQVTAINGLNISVDLDTSIYDVFSVPAAPQGKPASLTPAGSRNLYDFQNVPFHSYDGQTGN